MKEKVFKFVKYLEMMLIILCLASFKPAKLNVNSISEFSNEEVITFSSFKYSKFLDFSLSLIDIKNEENFNLVSRSAVGGLPWAFGGVRRRGQQRKRRQR